MGSILIGLIPALGWGFQGIIMQKIGGTTANKQMGMVLTAPCHEHRCCPGRPHCLESRAHRSSGRKRNPLGHRPDSANQKF